MTAPVIIALVVLGLLALGVSLGMIWNRHNLRTRHYNGENRSTRKTDYED